MIAFGGVLCVVIVFFCILFLAVSNYNDKSININFDAMKKSEGMINRDLSSKQWLKRMQNNKP